MNKLSTTLKGYYKHKSKKSSSNGEKFINKFKSGICSVCNEKFTEKNWCLECQRSKFKKNFDNWSSKNQHIDNFIQSSQLNCINSTNYLVWIPFDDFIQTKYLANGGFSAVYYAVWDDYENGRVRDVVLKRPHNDQISNPEFLKEQVSVYLYASSKGSSIIKCLGFTLHPTEGYMLVFEYAEEGDLRGYLNANYSNLTWIDKISILKDVAKAMLLLHNKDYTHTLPTKPSPCKKKLVETRALDYIDLMKKCWELEPTNRPSFQVIVTKIGEWMSSPSKHFSTKKSKSLESTDKAIKRESRSIIRLPFSLLFKDLIVYQVNPYLNTFNN
nr:5197_t:CDS:2 [Entrophospora candida]